MKYAKPELGLLGDAAHLIQLITGKPRDTQFDGTQFNVNPAYDLDE